MLIYIFTWYVYIYRERERRVLSLYIYVYTERDFQRATRRVICFAHVARPRGYSSREVKVHDMFICIFVYIYTERETCSLSFSLYIYTYRERDVRRVASSASLMLHGLEDTPLVRPRYAIHPPPLNIHICMYRERDVFSLSLSLYRERDV